LPRQSSTQSFHFYASHCHWEWQAHAAMPILTFIWKKVKYLRK
jgi:hypothetical protein